VECDLPKVTWILSDGTSKPALACWTAVRTSNIIHLFAFQILPDWASQHGNSCLVLLLKEKSQGSWLAQVTYYPGTPLWPLPPQCQHTYSLSLSLSLSLQLPGLLDSVRRRGPRRRARVELHRESACLGWELQASLA
jgi:hypothetical protein